MRETHGEGSPQPDENRLLRTLAEDVEAETGDAFFRSIVQRLAQALGVEYAFVSELTRGGTHFRSIALWARGKLAENFEVPLAGTPCEVVLRGEVAHHPDRLQQLFPEDPGLVDWGVVSYAGVPVVERGGKVLGHFAVLGERPLLDGDQALVVMRIFAGRAVAEIERARAEQALRDSEKEWRDLYELAPIAYIYEGTDSRFVSANRAAQRLLGLKPEEVRGTLGRSLVASTPETQQRVGEVLVAIQRGEERAGIELELRRKDDGRPVWVQWWSKPDSDGKYTRTMLVDITDRVLAEQERNRLQQQNLYLREEIESEYNFEEIVGRSAALQKVLRDADRVAATEASVLIIGETGTGKELVARAIHARSSRKDKPLVKVNCAALASGLVESEFFGHEKGAFTGASERRIGRFELAHGGTIFLDEVGEIPPEIQVKLLRVLQEREFERAGGSSTIRVDVRVIAATNRDLGKAIAEGKFRQDLFYRLNVFPVKVPPLREREGDLPLLVSYLVGRHAARIGRRIAHVSNETMERLAQYEWPGNVRELENVIERAVILSSGSELEIGADVLSGVGSVAPAQASPAIGAAAPAPGGSLDDVERRHIVETLRATGWRVEGPDGAATRLGVNPSTLRSRVKKLGISRSRDAAS
ncbi:MAG TPA: sigma 54-interacting transcriptional regulator [Myxococcota bacterium]|nr:sigma 54-interacting transcriptional regulator [Myxococcota bacterium]